MYVNSDVMSKGYWLVDLVISAYSCKVRRVIFIVEELYK